MSMRLGAVAACVLMLAISGQGRAAEGGKRGTGNMAQNLLDHADELGLTAEQKTKLEELAKAPAPMSVLTEEQRKKVREVMQATRAAGEKKSAKKDESKTEEKKPEGVAKKPEGDTKKDEK